MSPPSQGQLIAGGVTPGEHERYREQAEEADAEKAAEELHGSGPTRRQPTRDLRVACRVGVGWGVGGGGMDAPPRGVC